MTFRVLLLLSAAVASAPAQSGKGSEPGRPPLFLREDFKETPAATPITQDDLNSPNLLLALYGPTKAARRKVTTTHRLTIHTTFGMEPARGIAGSRCARRQLRLMLVF